MIAQTPYQNMIYSQPQMAYTPQMYNPWTTRPQSQAQPMPVEQPQQVQQVMQPQVKPLTGKVVQTLEAITANDVPMDGTAAFFPKQDLSEIYVKGWNADGTIKTIVYKPYTDPKDNQTVNSMANTENAKFTLSDESTQLFLNKFEELSEKIGQLEDRFDKSLGTQRKSSRTQSKGGDEE